MNTEPVSLPVDVRHLGVDDVLNAASISAVTRALADRDVQIARVLNALIQELSAQRILTAMPLPRVALGGLESVQLANFRIPAGYYASVLNAAVASTPTAGQVVLKIQHSSGTFGQAGSGSGVTELVTTSGEYSLAGVAVAAGELIITVTNSSAARLAASASVLLALTPLSA